MLEIMLELCDKDLNILISPLEIRHLLEVYEYVWDFYPFPGLKEIVEQDRIVRYFFQLYRSMVMPHVEADTRAKKVLSVFRVFTREVQKLTNKSEWAVALLQWAEDAVIMDIGVKIALQRQAINKSKNQKVWLH